jgi:glycine/D-amino acid oxidase-like deaminating enzyme/nitrite reductase/ring-hydroxylating ferredoxin subunit
MGKVSVWFTDVEKTSFPPLNKQIEVDVAIIGGGITGITAAFLLAKAGKKVAVLEAHNVGTGSTGFSTGNLYCPIGGEGLHSIAGKFNEAKVRDVLESRSLAVDLIEQIIRNHHIDCDFRRVPWSLFTVEGHGREYIEKEQLIMQNAGFPLSSALSVPYTAEYGFTVPDQAQFNPLKYVVTFARMISDDNCQIFENTRVTGFEDGAPCTVQTENGSVIASQVIMATHTPKGIYMVHTNLGPYREYAVAVTLKGKYPDPGIFWELQDNGHYSMRIFDSHEGKLLMALGESHKVGQKVRNEECYDRLEAFLRKRFKVDQVVYKWSAQQYKASDILPYIGKSPTNKNTYIATGFAADGLTYGTLAAMIISDSILGRENKWSDTYDASRLTPIASAQNFIKENVNVAYELIKDWISSDSATFEDVKNNEGRILDLPDGKHAVHRDGNGELHICSAVCPHMGCIVHWNHAEESWDCPCHGSRFSKDGEVLEGPAINPLKKVHIR